MVWFLTFISNILFSTILVSPGSAGDKTSYNSLDTVSHVMPNAPMADQGAGSLLCFSRLSFLATTQAETLKHSETTTTESANRNHLIWKNSRIESV